MAKIAIVRSRDLSPMSLRAAHYLDGDKDVRAPHYVDVDGLPLDLHKELEKINLRRKRLREELARLDSEAEHIESQRKRG